MATILHCRPAGRAASRGAGGGWSHAGSAPSRPLTLSLRLSHPAPTRRPDTSCTHACRASVCPRLRHRRPRRVGGVEPCRDALDRGRARDGRAHREGNRDRPAREGRREDRRPVAARPVEPARQRRPAREDRVAARQERQLLRARRAVQDHGARRRVLDLRARAGAARRSTATRIPTGATGTYAIGDGDPSAIPSAAQTVPFGAAAAERADHEGSRAVSQPQTILVVEDEPSIASFVSLYLKNAGYDVRAVGHRRRCAERDRGRDALADHPRPQPAGHGRDRDLPPRPQELRRADPDAHRARRGRRQDHRPRGRCGRLPDEAVQPARARRAREERPPPLDVRPPPRRGRRDPPRRPRRSTPAAARCSSATRRSSSRPKEFDLLWELLDHRGIVLTRDQLLERVWGYTFAGDTRTVDVHVRQIRRKLGDASPIVTVWGVGYKVASERTTAPAA